MKDLAKKVAVGISTVSLIASGLVVPAFAGIEVVISGNGNDTSNTVGVNVTNSTIVDQTNVANVSNQVTAVANTGDNKAEENTGGAVEIDTGNAKTTVDVTNAVNSNEAHVACATCPTDVSVEVSENGTESVNGVELGLTNSSWVVQNNVANLHNDVTAKSNTGENSAKENTGGDLLIDTGDATAEASVTNQANANVAWIGSSSQGALDLIITGNGANTKNSIVAKLVSDIGVVQTNLANLDNEVEVVANTGDNDAEENTGGESEIDTGNATAVASVDNEVNFNWANVADCCEFDGLVKIAGNGVDSENEVELELASGMYATQDNQYVCENRKPCILCFFSDLLGGGGGKHHDCNDVYAKANSGENDLEESTGSTDGDPTIDTGDATSEVNVDNAGNSNVFSTGDALPELPEWDWDGDLSMNWFLWLFGFDLTA